MVHGYSAQVFNHLNGFEVASPLGLEYEFALPILGAIICRHGFEDELGVSLIHKHFDLELDEHLVEQVYPDKTLIQPRSVPLEIITPYLWKYHDFNWYPLEFCLTTHLSPPTLELANNIDRQPALLDDLAVALRKLDMTEVFGLALLHRSLPVSCTEVLVETTDHTTRTLTWQVFPETALNRQQLTPTLWQFDTQGHITRTHNCGHCFHSPEA